jgi:hypothetical protein
VEDPDADEAVCIPGLGQMQVIEELEIFGKGVGTE